MTQEELDEIKKRNSDIKTAKAKIGDFAKTIRNDVPALVAEIERLWAERPKPLSMQEALGRSAYYPFDMEAHLAKIMAEKKIALAPVKTVFYTNMEDQLNREQAEDRVQRHKEFIEAGGIIDVQTLDGGDFSAAEDRVCRQGGCGCTEQNRDLDCKIHGDH